MPPPESRSRLLTGLIGLALGACQAPQRPDAAPPMPDHWHAAEATARAGAPVIAEPGRLPWYGRLHDPAIDILAEAALAHGPDLAAALARVAAARAALAGAKADARPALNATTTTWAQVQADSTSERTQRATETTIGLGLSWEIDLFGRLQALKTAARQRLDARSADAQAVRLLLAAQVAQQVLAWRGCEGLAQSQAEVLRSQQATQALVARRVAAGAALPSDEAQARQDSARARAAWITQAAACGPAMHALVALTGEPMEAVSAALAHPPSQCLRSDLAEPASPGIDSSCSIPWLPEPPPAQPALPAVVLARHPQVQSAEREADAAWAEVQAAHAARHPRLSLSALLSGQWLRIGGDALHFPNWSAGPALSLPLLDGGASAAAVAAAQARHQEAEARLRATVLACTRDVEDALLARASADQRLATAQDAQAAAHLVWRTTARQHQAGAVSSLALAAANRRWQAASAEALQARTARAQAWVGLVLALGDQGLFFEPAPQE